MFRRDVAQQISGAAAGRVCLQRRRAQDRIPVGLPHR